MINVGELSFGAQEISPSSWLYYASYSMREMCTRRGYPETRLNHWKGIKETWIKSFQQRVFRVVPGRPRVVDSSPVRHQETNIVSGGPQRPDIQKELGWNLVLWWTSAGSWVKLLTHPKRIEMDFIRPEKGWRLLEKVVSDFREDQKTFMEEELKFEDDPSFSTLFSGRFLAEQFRMGGQSNIRELKQRLDWYLTS